MEEKINKLLVCKKSPFPFTEGFFIQGKIYTAISQETYKRGRSNQYDTLTFVLDEYGEKMPFYKIDKDTLHLSDYFYTLKEARKLKIKKLNENR